MLEFYETYRNMEDTIIMTQEIIQQAVRHIEGLILGSHFW